MTRETDYLVQSLFERESMEEMTLDELKGLSEQYPFSSIIQFLYTCKLKSLYHLDFPNVVTKTALFFDDPYWLDFQLSDDNEAGKFRWHQYERTEAIEAILTDDIPLEQTEISEPEPIANEESQFGDPNPNEEVVFQEPPPVKENVGPEPVPLEPYHTVDYFASQGIKLNKEEEKDELSNKVKSFTAWLKTMKRLQPEPDHEMIKDPAVFSDEKPEDGDVTETILTEAMAEVYLKQGLNEKAISIYEKLSLQNPANSHIFAARIRTIKENNI